MNRDTTDQVPMNMYEEHITQTEDSYEQKRTLKATDQAVSFFVPFIQNHISQKSAPKGGNGRLALVVPEAGVPAFPNTDVIDERKEDVNPDRIPNVIDDELESARDIFYPKDDDTLAPQELDFKGQSKKEQQKRLIILYTWAYKMILKKLVPNKEHFIDVAKSINAYDCNFSRNLNECTKEYILFTGTGFTLKKPGEVKLETIMGEIKDPQLKGCLYWETTSRPVRRPNRLSKKDDANISEWIEKEINIGKINVSNLNIVSQVMFALWSLGHKGLNVAPAVKPGVAFLYLTGTYSVVSAKRDAFTKSMSAKKNDKRFSKNAKGEYYLTPDAEAEVCEWFAGTKELGQ